MSDNRKLMYRVEIDAKPTPEAVDAAIARLEAITERRGMGYTRDSFTLLFGAGTDLEACDIAAEAANGTDHKVIIGYGIHQRDVGASYLSLLQDATP